MQTTYKERVTKAVSDPEWQTFRKQLKGMSTEHKLVALHAYWNGSWHTPAHVIRKPRDYAECDTCIRIDNYIKALCRGGQLNAGESLMTALEKAWQLPIKK